MLPFRIIDCTIFATVLYIICYVNPPTKKRDQRLKVSKGYVGILVPLLYCLFCFIFFFLRFFFLPFSLVRAQENLTCIYHMHAWCFLWLEFFFSCIARKVFAACIISFQWLRVKVKENLKVKVSSWLGWLARCFVSEIYSKFKES